MKRLYNDPDFLDTLAVLSWIMLAGIFLWMALAGGVSAARTTSYVPEQGEIVDYQLLLEHHPARQPIRALLFWGLVLLLFIYGLSRFLRLLIGSTWILIAVLFLVTGGCCLLLVLGWLLSEVFADGTAIQTEQTVETPNQIYYLARVDMGGMDSFIGWYVVYECDTTGRDCLTVTKVLNQGYTGGKMTPVSLRTDEDTLYLHVGDDATLIAP